MVLWLNQCWSRSVFFSFLAFCVFRYTLPGIHALNFVLRRSLGGGGVASLRSDPQVIPAAWTLKTVCGGGFWAMKRPPGVKKVVDWRQTSESRTLQSRKKRGAFWCFRVKPTDRCCWTWGSAACRTWSPWWTEDRRHPGGVVLPLTEASLFRRRSVCLLRTVTCTCGGRSRVTGGVGVCLGSRKTFFESCGVTRSVATRSWSKRPQVLTAAANV